MDPNIVWVPEKNNGIPKDSAGCIIFNKLNTFNKDSIALVEVKTGEFCTFGDLIQRSLNLASTLQRKFGLGKNDIIAVISDNSCKFWITALAGLYLATPLHLLSPGYTIYELHNFLTMSQPKLVFCTNSILGKVKSIQNVLTYIKYIVVLDDCWDNTGAVLFYNDLVQMPHHNFEIEKDFRIEDQVAIVCNSSGTTGLPKGVMITHDNLYLNFSQCQDPDLYQQTSHLRILQIIPFYHIYGFTITFCALYLGAKVIVMDQFHPNTYLENIQEHKINKLFIVPALASFLANNPLTDMYDLSSIEEILCAAGVLSEDLQKMLKSKFRLKTIRQTYGLTELAAAVFITPPDLIKPGSCGKLTPGHQVKIIDTKTQKILGPKQAGEICVKGYSMKGYLNDVEKTQETIDGDGFVHTGDVGYYDEDHFFFIVDRIKDLIKYKSFQVAPAEIEEVLLRHPAIEDVAVVGQPDERCGELPVAFVVRRNGVLVNEDEIREFVAEHVCVEKQLHGGVRFVEEIPRSGIGKILRKQLRSVF